MTPSTVIAAPADAGLDLDDKG